MADETISGSTDFTGPRRHSKRPGSGICGGIMAKTGSSALSFAELVENEEIQEHTLGLVDQSGEQVGTLSLTTQFDAVKDQAPNPNLTADCQLKVMIEEAEVSAELSGDRADQRFFIRLLYDGEYINSKAILANEESREQVQTMKLANIQQEIQLQKSLVIEALDYNNKMSIGATNPLSFSGLTQNEDLVTFELDLWGSDSRSAGTVVITTKYLRFDPLKSPRRSLKSVKTSPPSAKAEPETPLRVPQLR